MVCDSDNGGRTAAALTSLVATCKQLGIDPFTNLHDLFGRIARHPNPDPLATLLPMPTQVGKYFSTDSSGRMAIVDAP